MVIILIRDVQSNTKIFMNPVLVIHLGTIHPVEEALLCVKEATDVEEVEKLKEQRAIILCYFKPQYRRLVNVSTNITKFIKRYNVDHGFPPPNWIWDPTNSVVLGILLLEDYAAAFKCDVPNSVRSAARSLSPRRVQR